MSANTNRILLLALLAVAGNVVAAGSALKGQQLYANQCIACHSVDVNLAGPAHRGVFGRKAGLAKDFVYSPALKKSQIVWNEETLDSWLKNPEKMIPGQQMGYTVTDEKDRQDLIAYLKTLTKR